MQRLPPSPLSTSLQTWAQQIYQYLLFEKTGRKEVAAEPVFLAHLKGDEKAVTDGILMFDPIGKKVVVSVDGVWKQIEWAP